MIALVAKTVLTLIVWAAYFGICLLAALRYQARKKSDVPLPAAARWVEDQANADGPVSIVLFFAGMVAVLATLIVPVLLSFGVWTWGGNDGCPEGQMSVADGTATPILIKGVTYYVPNHVCVLDR